MIIDVLGRLLKAIEHEGSQKNWAEKHGVSKAYVCDVVKGRKAPGDKILDALDLIRIIAYKKKERKLK